MRRLCMIHQEDAQHTLHNTVDQSINSESFDELMNQSVSQSVSRVLLTLTKRRIFAVICPMH